MTAEDTPPDVVQADVDGLGSASKLVVDHLAAQFPLVSWSVTRCLNDEQLFVASSSSLTGMAQPWSHGICAAMAEGAGPRSAPDVDAEPAYRDAPVRQRIAIKAFTGVAILETDGSVYGSLCGMHDQPVEPRVFTRVEPLLDVFAALLGMVLIAERERSEAARQAEAATELANTDKLTGLLNRRGWDQILARESRRLLRLLDPAVLVIIDLDGLKAINDAHGHLAGDVYLQTAARLLSNAVRTPDLVARVGGDEFACLLLGLTSTDAESRVAQLIALLHDGGVQASAGWAPLDLRRGLEGTLAVADERMYSAKRRNRPVDGAATDLFG